MHLKGLTCYPCFAVEEIEILKNEPAYSAPSNSSHPRCLRSHSVLCLQDCDSTDSFGYT